MGVSIIRLPPNSFHRFLVWPKLPPLSPIPSPKYIIFLSLRISSAIPSRTATSQLCVTDSSVSGPCFKETGGFIGSIQQFSSTVEASGYSEERANSTASAICSVTLEDIASISSFDALPVSIRYFSNFIIGHFFFQASSSSRVRYVPAITSPS